MIVSLARPNRRMFFGAIALGTFELARPPRLLLAGSGPAADVPDGSAAQLVTAAAQRAIDRGLANLASRQNQDGSFAGGTYGRNVAVCGLVGMAWIAGGSTPGRGAYGKNVSRCVDYLLANTQASGFIQVPEASSHGPMYGHGFATLFLAEVYGMSPHAELREKLSRAVQLIQTTQNDQGGWRYQPQPRDADISVTVCQVMALRAARNAGIYVSNQTIDRAVGYIKRSQNADGGFMYTLEGGPSAFPRSAAGLVGLYSAGIYQGPEVRKALDYLMGHVPEAGAIDRDGYFFYGQYYAVQAMWHAGGQYWQRWYPAIRDRLLPMQHEDGYWMDPIGPEYGTAMATLILQIPNGYLPIFQR